jgi:cell division protein FtsQ
LAISIPRHADREVERQAERRAEPARPRSVRSILFVAGASTFVVLVALFAVSRSPLFALRHVDVTVTGHRSAADVRALAELPLGTNVAWLDTTAVAARIERDRWIASATVTRSFPWSVEIRVRQHTPVAVLASDNGLGRGELLAADGTLLGAAPEGTRLPTITLPPAAPATLGMPGEDGAVRALAAMSPAVRHRVRQIDVGLGGTLTALLRGGTTVALGPAVDVEAKARMLRRVLVWERTTGTSLGTVSLVAPTAPAATIAG